MFSPYNAGNKCVTRLMRLSRIAATTITPTGKPTYTATKPSSAPADTSCTPDACCGYTFRGTRPDATTPIIPTTSGASQGAPCVFPFIYDGVPRTSCIDDNNNGVQWCATTSNYALDKKWGNCFSTDLAPTWLWYMSSTASWYVTSCSPFECLPSGASSLVTGNMKDHILYSTRFESRCPPYPLPVKRTAVPTVKPTAVPTVVMLTAAPTSAVCTVEIYGATDYSDLLRKITCDNSGCENTKIELSSSEANAIKSFKMSSGCSSVYLIDDDAWSGCPRGYDDEYFYTSQSVLSGDLTEDVCAIEVSRK